MGQGRLRRSGIIKVDLLGLGMMAVLKDCMELIPEHYGKEVDLAQLPEDDEVYGTLQRADTVGMFQVESRAQMASLPRNSPKDVAILDTSSQTFSVLLNDGSGSSRQ